MKYYTLFCNFNVFLFCKFFPTPHRCAFWLPPHKKIRNELSIVKKIMVAAVLRRRSAATIIFFRRSPCNLQEMNYFYNCHPKRQTLNNLFLFYFISFYKNAILIPFNLIRLKISFRCKYYRIFKISE